MFINDSRRPRGIGILPLQHEDHIKQGISIDMRTGIVACRIKERLTDFEHVGRYWYDAKTVGDLNGGMFWPENTRPIGSWQFAFPVRLAKQRSSPTGTSTRGGGGRTPQSPMIPMRDEMKEDTAFATLPPILPTFDNGSPMWPKLPKGHVGIGMKGVNTEKQVDYFHPTDPRMVAASQNGEPEYSSMIFDLTPDNEYDPERMVRLHDFFRICKKPSGEFFFPDKNLLAWNIFNSNVDTLRGGWVYDLAFGGQHNVIGGVSHNVSGPFDAGIDGDQHSLGKDEDGHPINSLHLSTNAYFREPTNYGDAPLFFEKAPYPNIPPRPNFARVHLVYDDREIHPFVLGERRGMWKWYAETTIYTITTGYPPPPPPPPPPPNPPLGTPTGGGGSGGSDVGGLVLGGGSMRVGEGATQYTGGGSRNPMPPGGGGLIPAGGGAPLGAPSTNTGANGLPTPSTPGPMGPPTPPPTPTSPGVQTVSTGLEGVPAPPQAPAAPGTTGATSTTPNSPTQAEIEDWQRRMDWEDRWRRGLVPTPAEPTGGSPIPHSPPINPADPEHEKNKKLYLRNVETGELKVDPDGWDPWAPGDFDQYRTRIIGPMSPGANFDGAFVGTNFQQSIPGFNFRPQDMTPGSLDLRYGSPPPNPWADIASAMVLGAGSESIPPTNPSSRVNSTNQKTPVVGTMSSFGQQGGQTGTTGKFATPTNTGASGDPWTYNESPGTGRTSGIFPGGTARGGIIYMPPEVDIVDMASDFAPTGVTPSEFYVMVSPGAYFGAGSIRSSTARPKLGYRWGIDSANALLFERTDTWGVPSKTFKATTDGLLQFILGDSTSFGNAAGKIEASLTTVSTAGTGSEESLLATTIPANALNANGKGVKVRIWGKTAANANVKTIKAYVGVGAPPGLATQIITNDITVSPNNLDWSIDLLIFRTSASNQKYASEFHVGACDQTVKCGTLTYADTTTIFVMLYAQAAAGDISAHGMLLEAIT